MGGGAASGEHSTDFCYFLTRLDLDATLVANIRASE